LDEDGDGSVGEEEIHVGAGLVWPLWLAGKIPDEAAWLGLGAGWNSIDLTDPDAIAFGDSLDLPLDAALWPVEHAAIGGALEASEAPPLRLAVSPGAAGADGTLEPLPVEAPLADLPLTWGTPWALTIDGPPPADHLVEHGANDWYGALEFLRLYEDSDGSEGLSDGDRLDDALCWSDEGAYLAYGPGLTSPTRAFFYAWLGLPAGWAAMTGQSPETWVILDGAQMADLGHCALE
jgi:hypothetical protein